MHDKYLAKMVIALLICATVFLCCLIAGITCYNIYGPH